MTKQLLPTQEEIDAGPHAGITTPLDYLPDVPLIGTLSTLPEHVQSCIRAYGKARVAVALRSLRAATPTPPETASQADPSDGISKLPRFRLSNKAGLTYRDDAGPFVRYSDVAALATVQPAQPKADLGACNFCLAQAAEARAELAQYKAAFAGQPAQPKAEVVHGNPCKDCGGSGMDGDVGEQGQVITVDCAACHGTGEQRAALAGQPAAQQGEGA